MVFQPATGTFGAEPNFDPIASDVLAPSHWTFGRADWTSAAPRQNMALAKRAVCTDLGYLSAALGHMSWGADAKSH